MRASSRFKGTAFEMSEGTATFLSGGLASFTFWVAAIPADNVKKYVVSNFAFIIYSTINYTVVYLALL